MKWILFYQTPYDRVNFITDDNQDRSSLSYKKFCDSLLQYKILDRGKLQIELDTFHTVFLDVETGVWHQEKIEDEKQFSFDELVQANPNPDEKKKQDEEKSNREVIKTKNYFDLKWEEKKGNLLKNYEN